jgi:hypothetical protein
MSMCSATVHVSGRVMDAMSLSLSFEGEAWLPFLAGRPVWLGRLVHARGAAVPRVRALPCDRKDN